MKHTHPVRQVVIAVALSSLAAALSSCLYAGKNPASSSSPSSSQDWEAGKISCKDGDGSYDVPEGWIVAEGHSSEDKLFFVRSGEDDEEQPDNISVEQGTCKYTADESTSFARAIAAQLTLQMDADSGDSLHGTGTYTETGEPLIVIAIEAGDGSYVDTQYYVLGNKEYFFVHETNFTGSTDVDDAAEQIVNSFRWPE
jgi:hypothetical protein